MVSKKKARYTTEDKVNAIRLLKENGYDYVATERELRIPRATLHTWNDRYSSEMNVDKVNVLAIDAEVAVTQYKSNFLKTHFNKLSKATELAIDRATELLKSEEDLTKVNGTIKVLSEMISKLTTLQGNGENNPGTTNIVRQSIIQLNQMVKK